MSDVTGKTPTEQGLAVSLLDRETPPDYVAQWTTHVALEKKTTEPDSKSVLIFRIDKEWLALSTDLFQEVMDHCTIRTLPDRRGGMVRGLLNVRGELLLCIALEVVLGMENAGARTPQDRVLIFGRGNERFAVQVSEVFGVIRYHPKDLRLTPATLRRASSGSYTTGILPWQGRSVACLDEALLLYALNRGLA